MTRLRLPAIALTFVVSSNAWADLKTYDVDPQYRQEIYAALQRILAPQGQPTNGRVELLPSGQLLVNASTETLDAVEQVLQGIRNRPAAVATPRVDLHYWAVIGNHAPVADPPPGTPPPNALGDVLTELERLHGDLSFRVLGSAALTTESGQHGQVGGTSLEVEQTAFVQGDTLNATIEMNLESRWGLPLGQAINVGSVEVRTALRRGDFVVLGQSDFTGNGGLNGPVFYIVHWAEE